MQRNLLTREIDDLVLNRQNERPQLPKTVRLTINWTGVNNGSLEAKVIVKVGKKIFSDTGNGQVVLDVDWAKKYPVTIVPKFWNPKNTKDPNNMYMTTSATLKNTHSKTDENPELNQTIALMVNRWNWIHVDASWASRNINRTLAKDVKTGVSFLGKTIIGDVNKLVIPKLAKTELAFHAPGVNFQQVSNSIAKIGGGFLRTMTSTTGVYSNHSLGCAFDINENMPTRQNHHFIYKNEQQLLLLVQHVVREQVGGKWSSFDIQTAKGLDQLDASNLFTNVFPAWLYNKALQYSPLMSFSSPIMEVPAIRDYTPERLGVMIKTARQPVLKVLFETILKYRDNLISWQEGTVINGVRLYGMICFDREFLRIMLENGWRWGGNYKGLKKDYMHFEDMTAAKQIDPKAK